MARSSSVRSKAAISYAGAEESGRGSRWCGKTVSKGHKALFFVFLFLGIAGLGAAGVGLAGLGGHQGWWAAGALSNLGQTPSIVMLAVGGATGIVSTICVVYSVRAAKKSEVLAEV